MATIINTPPAPAPVENSNNSLLVIVFLVILFVLFIAFGLPRLRGGSSVQEGDTNSGSEINVDVPDKIEIDTNPE